MLSFSSLSLQYYLPSLQFCCDTNSTIFTQLKGNFNKFKVPVIFCCSDSSIASSSSEAQVAKTQSPTAPLPVRRRRRRYRKQYPGEKIGITEEMRFVAMMLRNTSKIKRRRSTTAGSDSEGENNSSDDESDSGNVDDGDDSEESISGENDGEKETWQPSMEGFVKYLVDSKLVFDFIERIVDESSDVSYAYFRKTGLERSKALSKDLEWFSQQDIVVPEPSNPGVTYVKYLEELAEKSPPLFLCHFYNIYFSHIAGGQAITKQVSEKILEGKELEFFSWEGESEELLRGVREKLNMLGEHWSRDVKNKCLKDTTKSFRFLGQIVRLIII